MLLFFKVIFNHRIRTIELELLKYLPLEKICFPYQRKSVTLDHIILQQSFFITSDLTSLSNRRLSMYCCSFGDKLHYRFSGAVQSTQDPPALPSFDWHLTDVIATRIKNEINMCTQQKIPINLTSSACFYVRCLVVFFLYPYENVGMLRLSNLSERCSVISHIQIIMGLIREISNIR